VGGQSEWVNEIVGDFAEKRKNLDLGKMVDDEILQHRFVAQVSSTTFMIWHRCQVQEAFKAIGPHNSYRPYEKGLSGETLLNCSALLSNSSSKKERNSMSITFSLISW
jgi:hypothetical protein